MPIITYPIQGLFGYSHTYEYAYPHWGKRSKSEAIIWEEGILALDKYTIHLLFNDQWICFRYASTCVRSVQNAVWHLGTHQLTTLFLQAAGEMESITSITSILKCERVFWYPKRSLHELRIINRCICEVKVIKLSYYDLVDRKFLYD